MVSDMRWPTTIWSQSSITGTFVIAANGEDETLRRIDNRRKTVDAHAAEI